MKSLRKLGIDFGFLGEETDADQELMNRLDRSVKLDEVDTITFGLETDDGKIVKVYVKVDQADDFEKALSDKLGEIDDIEEVLNELSKEYEIVDVEWPSEDPSADSDAEESDGSDVLDKKVYDNAKEKAVADKSVKPKMEGLSIGERLTIDINENNSHVGTLESRFTTATQLMIYHAILELGIPEIALTRNAYRADIIKNIKSKALELSNLSTMKTALKTFINRSIDYHHKAEKNKANIGGHEHHDVNVKESLNESVTQDFWNAFLQLVNYIAATPEDAKELLANPAVKQLMTRSSASLSSNVTSQIKTKLLDFKNALSNGDEQLKSAGVIESYYRSNEMLNEGATPAEITDLFKTLLGLADSSKDGSAVANVMKSSAWNSFFNAAKGSLSQKFGGTARAKLNQLKAVLPSSTPNATTSSTIKTATESTLASFASAIKTEAKSLKNATLAHDYSYGAEKFDAGHPIEVIGEDGDSYIVKPFPIMANGHMKLKKTAVKLTGKINVPDGGPGGKMPGGLNEMVGTKKNVDPNKWYIWAWDGEVVIYGTCESQAEANAERLDIKKTAKARRILFHDDQFKVDKGSNIIRHYLSEETLNFKDSFRGSSFSKVKKHGTDKKGNTVYSGMSNNGFPSVIIVGKNNKMVANSINDGSCKTLADAEKKAKYAVDNEVFYWDNKEPLKCYNLTHNRPPELIESQVPDWSYDMEEDNVVIGCASLKVILNDEEVEKLVKGISNKDTVIVRDAEDPTHKVVFSPRGSSIMVKKVGTTDGVMMRMQDIDNLLDFISKGKPEEEAPPKEEPPEEAPKEDTPEEAPKEDTKKPKEF